MSKTLDELNEENRDVIIRMAASGDDLSKPRDIEFAVVFPDQESAESFASKLSSLGHAVSIEETHAEEDLPWGVKVVKHMLPVCEGITDFEILLQNTAAPLSGRNDGWGCFEQTASNIH